MMMGQRGCYYPEMFLLVVVIRAIGIMRLFELLFAFDLLQGGFLMRMLSCAIRSGRRYYLAVDCSVAINRRHGCIRAGAYIVMHPRSSTNGACTPVDTCIDASSGTNIAHLP